MFLSTVRADGGMDRSPYGGFFFSPVGMLTRTGQRVTPGSAVTLPTVLACVRVLSESFAIMPPMLYRPKVGGGRARVTDHWLYRLLARAPNRFQTPYEFRMMLMGHLALRGNAFCQITEDGKGAIIELLPLHPARMVAEMLPNGTDYRYRYTDQNGQTIYYRRDEIWHLRGLSDDGVMGLSLVTIAANAIGEGLAIQDYSSRFFANDAKPGGGWIEYPGQFADSKAKLAFRESWQEMQGGKNRGRVAVLERGMKFHELGLTNKDSQFIEARKNKGKEIAQVFRIPPHKVGIMDEATFSNIEQQAIEFWTDTMLPWAELWEASAEFHLLGPDTDLDVEFDMSRMMRGDGAARATRISTLVNCGVLTRNEGREEEGLDPIDGLDEPLRPLNMVEESDADDDGMDAEPAPTGPKPKPKAPGDEEDSADARRARHRARKAAIRQAARAQSEEQASKDAEAIITDRMAALLRSNAARIARRIADKKAVGADVIADAMAIPQEHAAAWCAENRAGTAEEIAASLVKLAGGFAGPLPQQVSVTMPAVVTVQPANVTVEPAAVHVTNNMPQQPAPVVNVAAAEQPVVQVEVNVPPQEPPVVNVTVPETPVNVEVSVPEQPAPVVNVSTPTPKVTVIDNHPTSATQTFERDGSGELKKAVTTYAK